jgi:acyl carrier protein phosphodiesterase
MSGSRTITYVISCESPERLSDVAQLAKRKIVLDNAFVDTVRSFPNGVEERKTREHRLRDYFDEIQVDHLEGSKSFRLVFRPRDDAGRFWKDLVLHPS